MSKRYDNTNLLKQIENLQFDSEDQFDRAKKTLKIELQGLERDLKEAYKNGDNERVRAIRQDLQHAKTVLAELQKSLYYVEPKFVKR